MNELDLAARVSEIGCDLGGRAEVLSEAYTALVRLSQLEPELTRLRAVIDGDSTVSALLWIWERAGTIDFCPQDPNFPVVVKMPWIRGLGAQATGYGKTLAEAVAALPAWSKDGGEYSAPVYGVAARRGWRERMNSNEEAVRSRWVGLELESLAGRIESIRARQDVSGLAEIQRDMELLGGRIAEQRRGAPSDRERDLRTALERARHALVTYQGLQLCDTADVLATWIADDSAVLAELDRVLGPPLGEVIPPLEGALVTGPHGGIPSEHHPGPHESNPADRTGLGG